jgi:integrase/recombinase XerD
VYGRGIEMKKLLESLANYLATRGRKQLGIENTLMCVKQYLSYLESRSLSVYQVSYKDAVAYRDYLALEARTHDLKPYKSGTINVYLRCIRRLYAYLLATHQVYSNPFASVNNVKHSRQLPRQIVTPSQMKTLLQKARELYPCDDPFLCVLYLLYGTGCRIGELFCLHTEDIFVSEAYIVIRDDKARQDRIAMLPENTVRILARYMQNRKQQDRLFDWKHRNTFTKHMNRELHKLCKEAELPQIGCHGIRHTLATHLLTSGADIRIVQEMLGHKDIGSTQIYTQLHKDELHKLLESYHPRAAL